MRAAIVTKYVGPTDRRGGRAIATAGVGYDGKPVRITAKWDYSLNVPENHRAAAEALRDKLCWEGELIQGWLSDESDVFVFAE